MPVFRNFLRESLKSGRSQDRGIPQQYDMARSGHNTVMDGDKQPKQALGNTKGRSTTLQKDTQGKAAVRETKVRSGKLSVKKWKP